MSVTVKVNVTCDGCDQGATTTTVQLRATTPESDLSVVSDVSVPGWTFFLARALCPACSKLLSIGLGMETP